ncbi:ABC transporter permease [Cohnella fermenti]|uniref:Sugar ABC transporter permease n=1 Tax=Cohnella fermenti TaxID=2565925 RepID=A0A4S4BUV6_9BACL|nr:ABC transporter permease subunit [Cohnella fermenti]THF76724.1 sugar ABC transporter permease [Cohnella fermenti]
MKNQRSYFKNNYDLYLMLLPAVAFYLIFKYTPMYGLLISFQDFNLFKGVFHSKWVGLDVFRDLLDQHMFWQSFGATLRLNLLTLAVGFPAPIVLALLLNEVANDKFKRVIQSISYMPHFISWVVVYGMIVTFVMPNTGFANVLLKQIGLPQIDFLTNLHWWLVTYIGSSVWKEIGFSSILYLAALSSIDSALYESADIDGAGRFRKIWHVTLPGIRSTVVILLILQVGRLVTIGFEQPYLFGNAMVSDYSNVLSVYIYKNGILQSQWSLATAMGLFLSVINFILLMLANVIATKMGESGLFGGKAR